MNFITMAGKKGSVPAMRPCEGRAELVLLQRAAYGVRGMERKMAKLGWGRILAGVATVAAAGAAYVYLRQRAARSPLYQVLLTDGAFEVRRYPALRVIETIQHGSRDRALGNGFGLLAAYMFGEGREGDEIPIVMPFLARSSGKGVWRVSFLIPEEYGDLPASPGEGISVGEIAARDVAICAVAGKPTDRAFAAGAASLQRWLTERGKNPAGPPENAYYNSPLEPGTDRPNEVLIPLNP